MNLLQREKLQKLINTSGLLSAEEKVEWLGLLDLMNDKQLAELENILSSRQYTAINIQKMEAVVAKPAPAALSHIVNLPNINLSKAAIDKPQAKPQSQIVKKISFSERLKSILSEKELPQGRPEYELELPAPAPKPVLPKVQPAKIEPKAPPVLKPLPPTIPKPPSKPLPPIIKPGLAAMPQRPTALPPVANPVEPALPKVDAKLETLPDLQVLPANLLESYDLNLLVSKIKSLVSRYGYHQTLSYIEQSPLYKSYIQTGAESLSKPSSLGQGKGMSRKEFEKMLDLLKEIQN